MLTKKNFLSVSIAALAISGLFVLACGDDDNTGTTPTGNDSGAAETSTGNQDSGSPSPGTDAGADVVTPSGPGVTVNVTYAGTGTGKVYVALFSGACTSLGPSSVPTKTAPVFDDPVTFPVTFKFTDVGAGSYCATSFMDVGNNNPGSSKPGDAAGRKDVIFAGADVTADIELHDIPLTPPDGGADGGDGG